MPNVRQTTSTVRGSNIAFNLDISTVYELQEYMDDRFGRANISELSPAQVQEVSDYNNVRSRIADEIVLPAYEELGLMAVDEDLVEQQRMHTISMDTQTFRRVSGQ